MLKFGFFFDFKGIKFISITDKTWAINKKFNKKYQGAVIIFININIIIYENSFFFDFKGIKFISITDKTWLISKVAKVTFTLPFLGESKRNNKNILNKF